MHEQIIAAIGFFVCLIRGSDTIDSKKMEKFQSRLYELLLEKFKGHWYPEDPEKGNAYRCVRVNKVNKHEKVLISACRHCGLDYMDILRRLPPELTIWIDPDAVCYRIGENKPIHKLINFKSGDNQSSGKEDPSTDGSYDEDPCSGESYDEDEGSPLYS